MKKIKIALAISLLVAIGLVSPPNVSVSAENDLIIEERDEELTHSVEFRGKGCFLALIPAPEVNDPIGIALPNIDHDIEYSNPKNPIIPESNSETFERHNFEGKK